MLKPIELSILVDGQPITKVFGLLYQHDILARGGGGGCLSTVRGLVMCLI